MGKLKILLCVLVLLCGTICGCRINEPPPEGIVPMVDSQTGQKKSEETNLSDKAEFAFQAGTWMAHNGERGQFYFFDTDGRSGRTAGYENGMGVGFEYEPTDSGVVFHMGSRDNSQICKVTVIDDTHMTLQWEGEKTEALTFFSALDSEHFHFYTDEELCALSLNDYTSKNDVDGTPLTAAAADNGDGTVTIQIYQNLSDHNSTAAWYQIDRCTGEGKNVSSDESVDLTNGSPDIDIVAFTPAVSQIRDYDECVADPMQTSTGVLLTAEVPVTDFRVVSVEYRETGENPDMGFWVTGELFVVDMLTPERPLFIQMKLPETIPDVGIVYVDRNGERKSYTISASGLDGRLLLTEENISS